MNAGAHNPFADGCAYIDGGYVPVADAKISIFDRIVTRGDATYDVAHVWKGVVFRFEDHIDRFYRNMGELGLKLDMTRAEMTEILLECVRRSELRDVFLQMTCTRGIQPRGTRDPRLCKNRFYAFAIPFVWIANEQQRRDGMHLHISKYERIRPQSVDPLVKNFHWLDLTRGLLDAFDQGADVEVLVDSEGNVTEGPGFNIFTVKDGRMATPAHGVFDGMTRRTVIEIAAELQSPVAERLVSIAEVRNADEVFISSTAGGIMPVTKIDGVTLGDGRPGPVSRRIHDEYWGRKEKGWLGTPVDYGSSQRVEWTARG